MNCGKTPDVDNSSSMLRNFGGCNLFSKLVRVLLPSDLLGGLKLPSNESPLNLYRKVVRDGSAPATLIEQGTIKVDTKIVRASNRRHRSHREVVYLRRSLTGVHLSHIVPVTKDCGYGRSPCSPSDISDWYISQASSFGRR